MNAISLSLFSSQVAAIADEMGAILRRSAFSPNIRDRLDFSCAVFDASGALVAQAAHIPVHLGSMAYAMGGLVGQRSWKEGDMVVVNDPYLGGTHLPDVTLIAPVFCDGLLAGFVANRAHHASIGSETPGSMPIAGCLEQEGIIISPVRLVTNGHIDEAVLSPIVEATLDRRTTLGDFQAQISANNVGVARLIALAKRIGMQRWESALRSLHDYGERLARAALTEIPDGVYQGEDVMDDDGLGTRDVAIRTSIYVEGSDVTVDFGDTDSQVVGNINCPLPVTAASVYYVFRCLMPEHAPACQGLLDPIRIIAPRGSLLNARPPAAVAAGNVETSTRIADVVLRALANALPDRIPAASQGTMNNLAMGARNEGAAWDYYETIAGGMGAGRLGGGVGAIQTHMTNTLNTPVEVLESAYPVRVEHYRVRRGSGGAGRRRGGDGVDRAFCFLKPARFTILSERRVHAPYGLTGGAAGQVGQNSLNGEELPAKASEMAKSGDLLRIQTPGGGGWGAKEMEGK